MNVDRVDLLSAALDYAARGWPVFPLHTPSSIGKCSCGRPDCENVGKHPRTEHGLKDATTNPAVIASWWQHWPAANIGIRTGTASGFFVLDIDGEAAAQTLKDTGRNVPTGTGWQRTGRGWQILFELPADFAAKSTTGTIAEHLDTRGEGGYIVAAPSMHANGKRYRWLTTCEPGPAPAWLLEALRPAKRPAPKPSTGERSSRTTRGALHPYVAAALEEETANVRAAADGTRNATLNAAAYSLGQLEAAGLTEPEAEDTLTAAALAAGLTAAETARTFASGWQAGRLEPRDIPERTGAGEGSRKTSPVDRAPAAEPSVAVDPEPVDLADLLDRTATFLRRFVIFPVPDQVPAVALWVAHTYVFDRFDTSPYLAITSPEKRCGKSRVFELLDLLVRRPWRAVTPSVAVLYRKLEQDRPTLLLDESDAIFGAGGRSASDKNEELRGVLNAGNRRGTTVDRCAGANRDTLQSFDIFSPKAFAGIGAAIPDTVTDRALVVRMARKAPGETVERFRVRKAEPDGHELRDLFARWAATAELPQDPDLPDELDDRAQDSWEVLLAIADAAGGEWPVRARQAALALSAGRTADTGSLGVRLLTDARQVFDAADVDRLSTADLLAGLAALEESPWSTLQQGEPMKPSRLAGLLKPYGIVPAQHRFGERTAKGYRREDFADAWRRYLQPLPVLQSKTKQGKHACKTPQNEGKHSTENGPDVSLPKPTMCRTVSDVSAGHAKRDTRELFGTVRLGVDL